MAARICSQDFTALSLTGLTSLNLGELCRITKVREFQALARLSEADGHLQQRIKQLLKLSKEKWDAACDHAKTAVQVFPQKTPSVLYCQVNC